MERLLSVNEFSKLSGIRKTSLRYWDTIGLFSPLERGPKSNYRYYSSDQLAAVNFIVFLSKLNIPLKTINAVMLNKTPGIFMRIGEKGSYVDNAHAGGLFVGVDRNGELGKYLCDQNGNKYGCFNGVDFANNTFVIPAFDKVLDFARSVGAKIPHLRVLQLDIMIDGSNRPRIIEFNCNVVGTWAFQFAMSPVFGEYTDEIIDYCKRHKKRNKWKV